jgi:hypothetical protein
MCIYIYVCIIISQDTNLEAKTPILHSQKPLQQLQDQIIFKGRSRELDIAVATNHFPLYPHKKDRTVIERYLYKV